jgi:O-antigen/teichoic acid export membrane protein
MRLSQKILYSVAGSGISIISGIVRNKIFAVFLSLELFGILSLSQQSLSLLFTFLSFGLPLGVTVVSSEIARSFKENQTVIITRLIVLACAFALVDLMIIGFVLFLNPSVIGYLITGNRNYTLAVSIILLATPLMVMQNCLLAVMEGMGKAREILLFKVVPVIIILPVTLYLTSSFHLTGAAMGVLANEFFLTVAGFFLLSNYLIFNRESFQVGVILLRVVKVALLSVGVGVSWLSVDFLVKRLVLDALGETANGIVQSVGKVTDLYPSVALSWLAMHLFPSISGVKDEKRVVVDIIHRTVFVAVALIVPMIILLFTFRYDILEIIYKKEFLQAGEYFGFMLSTGILKVFSWVIGVGLLAAGFRRHWFYSSLLFAIVYAVVTSVWLTAAPSVNALPVGLAIALLVQTIYVLLVFKRHGFFFSSKFYLQFGVYMIVSALLVASSFLGFSIVFAILLYLAYGWYFGLFNEVRIKIGELFSQV